MKSKDTPKPNPLLMDEIGHWDFPKEEPKQETLEEAANEYSKKKYSIDYGYCEEDYYISFLSFRAGAQWNQERSYSEEEVNKMFDTLKINSVDNVATIHNVELFISSWKRELKKK